MSIDIRERQENTYEALKDEFAYTNHMAAPKIEKVVVSTGVGSIKENSKRELIEDRLSKITGQKPVKRGARKSVASFRIRQGDLVGYQVTLRGDRMYDFLEKLLNVALPRMRDFRGLTSKIDEMGNLTIGVREHTIFPETSDEEIKDVFGLSITIVTDAQNKQEAEALLKHLGFPFKGKSE